MAKQTKTTELFDTDEGLNPVESVEKEKEVSKPAPVKEKKTPKAKKKDDNFAFVQKEIDESNVTRVEDLPRFRKTIERHKREMAERVAELKDR